MSDSYSDFIISTEYELLREIEACINTEPPSYDDFGDELAAFNEVNGFD